MLLAVAFRAPQQLSSISLKTQNSILCPYPKAIDILMLINYYNNSLFWIPTIYPYMANSDAALRISLIWLAAIMVVVGIWTQSLKKVMVTYVVGMLGIAGLFLPDWDFFDRDYSRWCYPITEEEKTALAQRSGFRLVLLQFFIYFILVILQKLDLYWNFKF